MCTFCPDDRVGTGPMVLPSGSSRLATFAADLVVGLVELAAQPAGVQVVGAGEAGELLPDPVGHPERG